MSPTILDALEDDLEASAMSTVPASSLAIRCLGRDRTHVDHETMDDPTVEAGPTQCDSAVSMPVASAGAVRRLVLVSSAQSHGRRVVLVPQSSGTPRSLQDVEGDNSDVESRAVVNQCDVTAADSENGDGSHPSPVATPRQLGDSESETESVASDLSDRSMDGPPEDAADTPIEPEVTLGLPRNVILRMALVTLDDVDPHVHFRQRASVMKTVPHFLRGSFRNALKLALEEATWGNSRDDEVRQERGWKLLMLLPRMLLHRAPGGGLISRAKLVERFEAFALRASEICNEQAAIARQRQRRRRRGDDLDSRVIRAENLVHVGELSSARQALEGDSVAPGTQAILDKLQDVQRRPPQPREAMPPEIIWVSNRRHYFSWTRNSSGETCGQPAEGSGKSTEWFSCMGGAARCLMSDVYWGSAVGTVAGPPAEGGLQILGGVPLFQEQSVNVVLTVAVCWVDRRDWVRSMLG